MLIKILALIFVASAIGNLPLKEEFNRVKHLFCCITLLEILFIGMDLTLLIVLGITMFIFLITYIILFFSKPVIEKDIIRKLEDDLTRYKYVITNQDRAIQTLSEELNYLREEHEKKNLEVRGVIRGINLDRLGTEVKTKGEFVKLLNRLVKLYDRPPRDVTIVDEQCFKNLKTLEQLRYGKFIIHQFRKDFPMGDLDIILYECEKVLNNLIERRKKENVRRRIH